jgi:tetratricopeptide (TPR) repeat protein
MGLFDNVFGNKSNQPKDQSSIDYVRINLLAKLGEENVEAKKYGDAINYIKEFFELMGRNSFTDLQHLIKPCFFNLALSYSNSGDNENAILIWSKFIQLDKTNFDSYFERLQSYIALGRLNEALLDIESALTLKPYRDDLYINKGIIFINMGNRIDARKAFSKALEMGNHDAQKYIDNYC